MSLMPVDFGQRGDARAAYGGAMTRTESDSELVARLERALAARGERAWSLVILAGASALAARLEPPLGAFWDWAALIAACASALAGAAALGARGERDAALDGI